MRVRVLAEKVVGLEGELESTSSECLVERQKNTYLQASDHIHTYRQVITYTSTGISDHIHIYSQVITYTPTGK